MAISCSSRCWGWSQTKQKKTEEVRKASACEAAENGSWCKPMEKDMLNRFSAALSALQYQYFLRQTSWENPFERELIAKEIQLRSYMLCKGNQKTGFMLRYAKLVFLWQTAVNCNLSCPVKTVFWLTFYLAKAVNGVLQLLTANRPLDLTARLLLFLAVSGFSDLGKSLFSFWVPCAEISIHRFMISNFTELRSLKQEESLNCQIRHSTRYLVFVSGNVRAR